MTGSNWLLNQARRESLYLDKLYINQFRNYKENEIDFEPGVNIILGRNAQGKTNLLEAVYFLSTGRSFRTHRDSEMLSWESDSFLIRGQIERREGRIGIRILYPEKGKKEIYVDGEKLRKLSDLYGHIKSVVFAPDDLELIKGSPSVRRDFLNNEISQINPSYHNTLSEYKKILYQRNSLLKRIRDNAVKKELLDPWDAQMVDKGTSIIIKRKGHIRR